MSGKTLKDAVSAFGAAAKAKLSSIAISGAPEEQLRTPLDTLFRDLADISATVAGKIDLIGETSLAEAKIRPDFAVTLGNELVGFIELKAPGKGADPRHFSDPHDKAQWSKLKALPNLIYTDGNSFSLWRDGVLEGQIIKLDGDISSSGAKLAAPDSLLALVSDFLSWTPTSPKSAGQLARISARLCRLLRDEVTEQLERQNNALTALATEWRSLLFPQASDKEFADGYAQAVTFGLLVARAQDISLADGIDKAALELRKTNSLIATALRLLTDAPENQQALKTSLDTLTRVLDRVNWPDVTKDQPEAWLYFYESFLEVYDNALRKRTGSYYTPPEVVAAMVSLVDEALRSPSLFARSAGLASPEVTIADPATGTGTFLLGVIRQIAQSISEDQGPGAVGPAIAAAAYRLIGFELQFGPFAVAQLRLIAEMQALINVSGGTGGNLPSLRLFVTDTLGDPFAEQAQYSSMLAPIGQSRKEANAIKRSEPITVVIGNPPYKEKAKGRGGWIEQGSDTNKQQHAPMDRWSPPVEWGVSAHAKHLKNLYIYFWRWATLKVFGSGWYAATGEPDTDKAGIVCYITVAGFLNGPGFEKMRDDLRRDCESIWVIDCSPDGHQPEVATRIFQDVQQPVCIVLAVKTLGKHRQVPATVRYRSLPTGRREEKFEALKTLSLDADGWIACSSSWRAPFLPEATGTWATFPSLKDLFTYDGSGVMPGRTWVIAPDKQSLADRWTRLIGEKDLVKKEVLFRPHLRQGKPGDKHVSKTVSRGLAGHEERLHAVMDDQQGPIEPVRYGFRTLDRQWIIPDARLINQPNPTLWNTHSPGQIYLTGLERASPKTGSAISFTGLIPDLDHYKGSFGGRVFPLWADAAAKQPNVRPELLQVLAEVYGRAVSAPDLMAYLAATMAHPAFTARFAEDLVQPGLRVPLTADPGLFNEAVEIGREVIWLHTYGERFADPGAGRPKAPPKMPPDQRPHIPADGTIPSAPEPLPDTMEYDATKRRLKIGKGCIDNVSPQMWEYEVSGKQVVWHWFSYRRRDRTRPQIGDKRPPSPLDSIQPDGWLAEYTSDLIDLLHVIGRLVALEPRQAKLLDSILYTDLIDLDLINEALAEPSASTAASG